MQTVGDIAKRVLKLEREQQELVKAVADLRDVVEQLLDAIRAAQRPG